MRLNPAGKQPKAAVEVRSNAGSKSSRGGGAGGGGSSSVQTLIVPPERVNETTFVMNVTNSPEESVEDDESSGVSRNPTPTEAATSRDADRQITDLDFNQFLSDIVTLVFSSNGVAQEG